MKSERHIWTLSLAVLLALSPSASAQLGGLGKKVGDVKDIAEAFTIDDDREIAMGAEAHPMLVADMGGLSRDQKLADYVTSVGGRVVESRQRDKITYRFFVVENPLVNAFALPGGYVYVTTGLLALLEDEAELAAVLGHEVAHVEERHGVEKMRKAVLAEKGADYSGEAMGGGAMSQEVARLVANVFANLALSGYGRKQEIQADELGLTMANAAGYDPAGAVRTFERLLEQEGGASGKKLANFLSSHPPTAKRIKQAEAQIARLGNKGTTAHKAEYEVATARLD